MKRMLWIVGSILAVLIALALTGRKSVHDEVLIEGSLEAVWRVLTDTPTYPDWNPVMEVKSGTLGEGQSVTYAFTSVDGQTSEIKAQVEAISLNQALRQKGGIPGVLTFAHSYTLTPSEEGCTVTIHEDYRGIGVHFWDPSPVEQAYHQLNLALKGRVEGLSAHE